MDKLEIFSNDEFGQIKLVNIEGKPYFVANDIARALGYTTPKDAVTRHCKGALKQRYLTEGGEQEVKIIPEGDVYRLIIRSKLPTAEKFEKWVFDEVLPSIRKQGSYAVQERQEILNESLKQIVKETVYQIVPEIFKQLEDKVKREKEVEREMKRISIQVRNRIEYLLFSENYTFSEISKILEQEGHNIPASTICHYAEHIGLY